MLQFTYVVRDELGIHARPAGMIVKAAQKYPGPVTITRAGKTVDAKRLLGLMGLSVKQGDSVTVCCDGEQEQDALEEMRQLFEKNL